MKERNYLSFPAVNLNSWMANGVVIKKELMLFLLSLLKTKGQLSVWKMKKLLGIIIKK